MFASYGYHYASATCVYRTCLKSRKWFFLTSSYGSSVSAPRALGEHVLYIQINWIFSILIWSHPHFSTSLDVKQGKGHMRTHMSSRSKEEKMFWKQGWHVAMPHWNLVIRDSFCSNVWQTLTSLRSSSNIEQFMVQHRIAYITHGWWRGSNLKGHPECWPQAH